MQAAVLEMEKVLDNPENVNIYKQHWETYEKQPHLLEKLRLENPVMHHLLLHFRSVGSGYREMYLQNMIRPFSSFVN